MARAHRHGLRKICECKPSAWAKCSHGWHFAFKWAGVRHRYSLDRLLPKPVRLKSDAEIEANRIRGEIQAGTFKPPSGSSNTPAGDGSASTAPVLERLTLRQLFKTFRKRYLETERAATLANVDYQIGTITRTELELPDGTRAAFGEWFVSDVTTDALEQFQAARRIKGSAAANRDLSLLRSMFNWAVRKKLVKETPFKIGTEVAIKLKREPARRRRLQAGEGDRLLAACRPHLRALVEAALETGCRKGELLSLQWWQVQSEPRAQLYLPAVKTKTREDRWIPISSRLQLILDMRHLDEDGEERPESDHVFGDETGAALKSFKRAWERVVLKAHGVKPTYVTKPAATLGNKPVRTAVLTPDSRAQLRAIDLNFHDLRREAGSRWLEGGVPLHTVRDWLGHSSVAQTSVYLAGTIEGQHDAMRRFEERQAALANLGTDGGTSGRKRPQTAAMRDKRASKGTGKHQVQ